MARHFRDSRSKQLLRHFFLRTSIACIGRGSAASPFKFTEREIVVYQLSAQAVEAAEALRIAIVTRAGPARMLGLRNKGHLGEGADAAMFGVAALRRHGLAERTLISTMEPESLELTGVSAFVPALYSASGTPHELVRGLDGKTPKRVIVVPNRIVNVVV